MSVSGLNPQQRALARHLTYQAAELLLHHAEEIHYSQGSDRWDGIADHLVATKGQFPRHSDCSATNSWLLAQGLLFRFHRPDVVNGLHWHGGFTGTMAAHGRQIHHQSNLLRGDQAFYGEGPDYDHVTMVMHHKGVEKPLVFSHGSEGGPYLLPFDYRPDFSHWRRYI